MTAPADIAPYPNDANYGLTRDGQVFRIVRARFGRAVPAQVRPCRNKAGYTYVTLSRPGRRVKKLVHRLVAETFIGPCPEGCTDAAHRNGQRDDNRADNLRWDTRVGNFSDKPMHGTDNRGERHPLAKLQATEVLAIKRRREAGERNGALALEYGVTPATISDITYGRSWAHV